VVDNLAVGEWPTAIGAPEARDYRMANDLCLCSLHVLSSVLGVDAGGALVRTKLEGALDFETSVVDDYLADMLGVT
jgi:hypothetical protein